MMGGSSHRVGATPPAASLSSFQPAFQAQLWCQRAHDALSPAAMPTLWWNPRQTAPHVARGCWPGEAVARHESNPRYIAEPRSSTTWWLISDNDPPFLGARKKGSLTALRFALARVSRSGPVSVRHHRLALLPSIMSSSRVYHGSVTDPFLERS